MGRGKGKGAKVKRKGVKWKGKGAREKGKGAKGKGKGARGKGKGGRNGKKGEDGKEKNTQKTKFKKSLRNALKKQTRGTFFSLQCGRIKFSSK